MNPTRELGIFSIFTCFGISAHVAPPTRAPVLDVWVGAIVPRYGAKYGRTGPRVHLAEKTRTRLSL